MREARWPEALMIGLRAAGRTLDEAQAAPKSAAWKLAVAAWMKQRTQANNSWLSAQLGLGAPAAFSRNLTSFCRNLAAKDKLWQRLTSIPAA